MLRRILPLLALAIALPALGATRYIREGAEGPVQWLEWSRAAVERAQKSNKPIFLSIGYAASWDCHRMHAEAFADAENAKALNTYYVPVLLDRFEHPEIAEAYELALQAMNVTAGCPMNVIVAPTLEPIAGAGWTNALDLQRMLVLNANRWAGERASVLAEAKANVAKARVLAEPRTPADVDAQTIEAVIDDIARQYERTKTLDPMTASFLFRYAARTKTENIRALALETLKQRAALPLRDQVGGGFHRSLTAFEKLLPDQALAAIAYTEAWQLTKDRDFEHVARTTLDYVLRDLRPPKGFTFEASQDAYSLVPRETGPVFADGAFYLWSAEEIVDIAGRDDGAKIARVLGVHEGTTSVPALAETRFLHETYDELAPAMQKLLERRQKRPAPFREPLVIAGWNGLAISALARAGAAFGETAYIDAAARGASEVVARLWNVKTRTLARTDSRAEALAEDYAFLVQGLLDLFEASYEVQWLELAIALQQRQDALFWDASTGRYATGATLPEAMRGLLVERDAGVPDVNAVAAVNLMRLAALTNDATWSERPPMIFQSFGGRLRSAGARYTQLARAHELSRIPSPVIVVTGDPRKPETQTMLRTYVDRPEPMRALVFLPHKGPQRNRVIQALPFAAAAMPDPERPVAYECVKAECRKL